MGDEPIFEVLIIPHKGERCRLLTNCPLAVMCEEYLLVLIAAAKMEKKAAHTQQKKKKKNLSG